MDGDTDFVAQLGRPFTAHRLRRLAELFLDGYAGWLPSAGVTAPARSLSTLLLLDKAGPLGVTELATRLRLTHPLMIKLTGALEERGFVRTGTDPADARRRPLALTRRGEAEAERVKRALQILDAAYAELFRETGIDLTDAARRVEDACLREPFHRRLGRLSADLDQQKEVPCV
jgi:DNA-binding MarR family transcriptional regulator